jgi:hypothetical protein
MCWRPAASGSKANRALARKLEQYTKTRWVVVSRMKKV